MSAPKSTAEMFEFRHHLSGSLALETLHHMTNRQMWRNRHENMHMIFGHMPFDDLDIFTLAYFPYQITSTTGNLTGQYRLAIFRDPYQMVFEIIDRMARFTIVLYAKIILKSSPKGEGFSPIPRRGQ